VERKITCVQQNKNFVLYTSYFQLVHVQGQLSVRHVEMEALERKVHVMQEAEIRRQKKRLLEQEEMDRDRWELQKAQSLQVRIYLIIALFGQTC
jgi:hypothetical protein